MSPRSRAAAVTLVALAVLAAGCAGDPQQAAAPPDETSPTSPSSPTSPTSTAPARPGAWVDGLPVGPPPEIGYVIGNTYHAPEGRMVRVLRDHGVTSIARLGDGFLVTSDQIFEGSTGVYVLDDRGRVDTSAGQPGHVPGAATVSGYPVLSADGATLHWLTFTPPESGLDLPTLLHAGDVATGDVTTVRLDLAPSFLTEVTGVIDRRAILQTGWGGRGEAWVSDGAAGLTRTPVLDRASMVSARARLVVAALGDVGIRVLDFDTRKVLWRQRHSHAMAFSPSGRQLLVGTRRRVSVVNARSGEVRHDVAPPPYRQKQWYAEQLAWEDERHLLASIELEHRAAVVRIDVRTSEVELAVDWTPTDGPFAVAFETRP